MAGRVDGVQRGPGMLRGLGAVLGARALRARGPGVLVLGALGLGGLSLVLACERVSVRPPAPPRGTAAAGVESQRARAAADGGHVLVLYPEGSCATRRIEVQVYRRDASPPSWQPHPEHPRIRTGSVQREDPARLLNELRVRCVDPEGRRRPSPWVVGARLRD